MCDDDHLVSLGIEGHKNAECRLSCGKPTPLRYPFSESTQQQQLKRDMHCTKEYSTFLQ